MKQTHSSLRKPSVYLNCGLVLLPQSAEVQKQNSGGGSKV